MGDSDAQDAQPTPPDDAVRPEQAAPQEPLDPAQPEAQLELLAEPDSPAENAVEPETEPALETESETESEAEAESAPTPEEEIEPGPQTEPEPEPQPDDAHPAEVEPGAETEAEPQAGPQAEPPSGAVRAEVPEVSAELPATRTRIPWWPFLAYFAVWLVAVGAATWLFMQAPAAASIAGEAIYPYTLRAGIALTALGPVLSLVVWLIVWIRAGRGRRRGLLSSALLKGALFTTLGVVVWWGMLVLVDRARFGRLW